MAWCRRKPAVGLMSHPDRGSQYASQPFQHQLRAYGMICSMRRKGDCWDHAPTESWFNSFKNEHVHGLRCDTRAAITAASFEYIEVCYNRTRGHSTLGYQSPRQFLEDWRVAQHDENRSICSKHPIRRKSRACQTNCPHHHWKSSEKSRLLNGMRSNGSRMSRGHFKTSEQE